jgi:hypothetical protein
MPTRGGGEERERKRKEKEKGKWLDDWACRSVAHPITAVKETQIIEGIFYCSRIAWQHPPSPMGTLERAPLNK